MPSIVVKASQIFAQDITRSVIEDAIIFDAVYDTCNWISTNKIEVMLNNNSLSVSVFVSMSLLLLLRLVDVNLANIFYVSKQTNKLFFSNHEKIAISFRVIFA